MGCVVVDKLAARRQWTAKYIIVSVMVTYFVLGGYTMLGFFTDAVGLKHGARARVRRGRGRGR